jgi:hypothetical protein
MADAGEFNFFSDTIDPFIRSSTDQLFLIKIEARPEPAAEDYGCAEGAFVICWVAAESLRDAERRAVALIRGNRWQPHRLESWEIVTREQFACWEPTDDDDVDPRYAIDQAFADGEFCEFFCWPPDAPDASDSS